MARWTFYDPSADETYTFETNPVGGGTPSVQNANAYEAAGPGSKALVFDRVAQPSEISISGTLHSQQQMEAFEDWCSRSGQILIVNDHGREQWVWFRSFEAERAGRHHAPWRHSYTISAAEAPTP